MDKGFTLIELLLVIAIIAIIGASTTPFLSRFVLQTNFDSTTDRFIGAIRKAQGYAMDGKDNQTWGICRSGSNIRTYSGSCNSPVISEDVSIPTSVTISNFSDTTFNTHGEPSNSLSVQISTTIESINIELNSAGGINTN